MKIEFEEGSTIEQRLLLGMIISDRFLRDVLQLYTNPKLLSNDQVRVVAGWCKEYYEKYKKAPKKHIQDIYHSKKDKPGFDPDLMELIGDMLEVLSEDFLQSDKFNEDYLLDQAESYFNDRNLERLTAEIEKHREAGRLDQAQALLREHKRIERGLKAGINPLKDRDFFFKVFSDTYSPLFTFPGDLGMMLNRHHARDCFVVYLGREKIGKSWWLMELMVRAIKNRNNVWYCEAGDMSESQWGRRFASYLARKPIYEDDCGTILVPVLDCYYNQTGECDRKQRTSFVSVIDYDEEGRPVKVNYKDVDPEEYQPCTYCRREHPSLYRGASWWREKTVSATVTDAEADRIAQRLLSTHKGKEFKFTSHPSDTLNVDFMRNQLTVWEESEGFVPDVIIVDYVDILAPEPGSSKEVRHQINTTWKSLRRLSQEKHNLVITATQANQDAYHKELIDMRNQSEDKRKNAHPTAVFSFNQTDEEYNNSEMRIAPVVIREGKIRKGRQVKVLQSLTIGRPFLGGYFFTRTSPKQEEKPVTDTKKAKKAKKK